MMLGDFSSVLLSSYPDWLKSNLNKFVDYIQHAPWLEETYQYLVDHNAVSIASGTKRMSTYQYARENLDFLAKELGIIDSDIAVAV